MEKYREKKKVVENGTSRQPSRQEVSQLNKWSKKYNISGMNGKTEENKRVQQFMQDENVDENKARRIIYMVRDFYNVTND